MIVLTHNDIEALKVVIAKDFIKATKNMDTIWFDECSTLLEQIINQIDYMSEKLVVCRDLQDEEYALEAEELEALTDSTQE